MVTDLDKATKIRKVCRIGQIKGDQRTRETGDIFIKVEMTDGKLSISGVIGPMRGGNAKGACGQIDMGFAHRNPDHNDKRYGNHLIEPSDIKFASAWDAGKWFDLLDIWKTWHLNDMQAGCEHQRRDWNTGKELVIVTYRLNDEVRGAQRRIKSEAMTGLKTVGQVKLTEFDQEILACPWEFELSDKIELTPKLVARYAEKGRETKAAGWVTESQHPGGLLSKPCPECGYKYGSAWLKAELPEEVIAFIEALPDTDLTPVWV